jgi:hypothetical protein
MNPDEEVIYEVQAEEDKSCAICDLGLATVGLLIGCVFLYISIDIFTKGAITRSITRGGGELV